MGRQFLPFGVFDTRMISEPLTLEVGETNEIAWNLGWGSGALQAAVFGFNGDGGLDSAGGMAGYGGAVSFSAEREEEVVALNLALTSDFGYADNVLGALADAAAGRAVGGPGARPFGSCRLALRRRHDNRRIPGRARILRGRRNGVRRAGRQAGKLDARSGLGLRCGRDGRYSGGRLPGDPGSGPRLNCPPGA